eukprot:5052774-Alexandrium_andersonii.AAC.2
MARGMNQPKHLPWVAVATLHKAQREVSCERQHVGNQQRGYALTVSWNTQVDDFPNERAPLRVVCQALVCQQELAANMLGHVRLQPVMQMHERNLRPTPELLAVLVGIVVALDKRGHERPIVVLLLSCAQPGAKDLAMNGGFLSKTGVAPLTTRHTDTHPHTSPEPPARVPVQWDLLEHRWRLASPRPA